MNIKQHTESKQVYTEAKNVQMALRLLSIDYYAENKAVYDSRQSDGLAEGIADELKELSGAEGEIYLVGWNDSDNAPYRLYYKNKEFVVEYVRVSEQEYEWNIYRDYPLFR